MAAYYNEIDPFAAQWLRELISGGMIADGEVDERSIVDVRPDELRGFTQCHFFAGIGVWSHALRRAGWADDRQVWTGSCPCQPFSAAGKGAGFDDERHLWPHFHWLIQQCQPSVVFGEQVASKDGLAWLDLVSADLEGTGYASGAVDLCAAGVGAPHIRQRLWWVAERLADSDECGQPRQGQVGRSGDTAAQEDWEINRIVNDGGVRGVADPRSPLRKADGLSSGIYQGDGSAGRDGAHNGLGGRIESQEYKGRYIRGGPSPTNGFWRDADWLFCRDGKWRPVEPGTSPLAYGAAARVGRLRGYGNAIVAQAAQAFIETYMETKEL